jgi:hypothetical protein
MSTKKVKITKVVDQCNDCEFFNIAKTDGSQHYGVCHYNKNHFIGHTQQKYELKFEVHPLLVFSGTESPKNFIVEIPNTCPLPDFDVSNINN